MAPAGCINCSGWGGDSFFMGGIIGEEDKNNFFLRIASKAFK
jgi:hypothetical protein